MINRAKRKYYLILHQIQATKAIWRDDQVLWRAHIDGNNVYIGPKAVVSYSYFSKTRINSHPDFNWRK